MNTLVIDPISHVSRPGSGSSANDPKPAVSVQPEVMVPTAMDGILRNARRKGVLSMCSA